MMERGRTFIAKKPSDLGRVKLDSVEILGGEAAPQAVDDLGEIRAFLGEPARKRSRAHRQRLGDDFRSSAAVRQQPLNLVSTAARMVPCVVLRARAASSQKGRSV